LIITSTHHQAQYPWGLPKDKYKILAFTKNLSPFHEDGLEQELPMAQEKEVEIAYYSHTRALAIQGHPEFMYPFQAVEATTDDKNTIIYLQNLLDKHMKDAIL